MNHDFDILTDAEIDAIAERLDDGFRPRLPGKLGKLVAGVLEDADGPTLRFLLRTLAKHKRRAAGRPRHPEGESSDPPPPEPSAKKKGGK